MEYLVLMVETRALNISWWSSQHQRVPPSGVNPAFFFLQHFRGTSWVNDECSVFASRCFTERDTVRLLCIFTSEKESCPEEADFLHICVTSTYPADQPNREPGSLFIQLKDQSSFHHCPGGRGAGGFWGGNHDVFRGEKMEVSRR